ncbi:MAG: NifU family protein [Myxococcota bacterium]|nr:NifU family protein [Myxococcota bacterium]MDW8362783.1 NifU family protein [Myxococcales bacterium]
MRERVEAVVADLVRPLVEADGGRVEIVEVTEDEIVLALGGACAGCPGVPITREEVLEPALATALGRPVRVRVVPITGGLSRSL